MNMDRYRNRPNRTRFLSVRFSEEDFARLVAAADRELPSWETARLSKWARRVLLEAAPERGQMALPQKAMGALAAPAGAVTQTGARERHTTSSSRLSHKSEAPHCPDCLHDDDALVLLAEAGPTLELLGIAWKCKRCRSYYDAQLEAVPGPQPKRVRR